MYACDMFGVVSNYVRTYKKSRHYVVDRKSCLVIELFFKGEKANASLCIKNKT